MNIVERYKNQHKIILSLCSALEEAAQLGVNEKEMSSYLSVLKTLDEILSTHLESEDTYLYPDLASNEDSFIQETAQKLHYEMFPITDVYKAYKSKYILETNILKDEIVFLNETKFLVEALHSRIEKEEKELYSLL
jgi:hemerythrin superfamily protein